MTIPYRREFWNTHLANLRWKQGEHVLICAPNGHGKTYLARRAADKRDYVVMFVGKPRDPIFRKEFKHWSVLKEWPARGPKPWQNHVLLWPEQKDTMAETVLHQRQVFKDAIDKLWKTGDWCMIIDETLQMSDPRGIGLGNHIGQLHYMGRSSNLSIVTLFQRPAWVPKIIYSSVAHAYLSSTKDREDLHRLGNLAGIDSGTLRSNLLTLPKFDFVYVNPHGNAESVVVNTKV